MKYNEALQIWGASRLERDNAYFLRGKRILPQTVQVNMVFNPGFACHGGNDPDCSCSLAEEPVAEVMITGFTAPLSPRKYFSTIEPSDFDFSTILGEIIAAGDGVLEA